MPWKESHPVDERMKFVVRLEEGERMIDLCEEFGISRKTGYKVWNRFQKLGAIGLVDGSHEPHRVPHRLSSEVKELILGVRKKHPSWGPKKLRSSLEQRKQGLRLPATSTIGELLKREGLVKTRRRRRSCSPSLMALKPGESPNELWCMDFKGQFRLGNGRYCYPLTITDHFSRFLLCCEALENTQGSGAQAICEMVFRQYGVPLAIRTDNGAPFASTGLLGLSRLSVWWLRLGIRLERIEPGHPEQNGRHERMHLTLKQETTRPAAQNPLQQQERFDRFSEVFNGERPHEGINMMRPADLYQPSLRAYPERLPEVDYPLHDMTRVVRSCGHLSLFRRNQSCYLSTALAGQKVGLREIEEDRWLVSFLSLDLGIVDASTGRFEPGSPVADTPCST